MYYILKHPDFYAITSDDLSDNYSFKARILLFFLRGNPNSPGRIFPNTYYTSEAKGRTILRPTNRNGMYSWSLFLEVISSHNNFKAAIRSLIIRHRVEDL